MALVEEEACRRARRDLKQVTFASILHSSVSLTHTLGLVKSVILVRVSVSDAIDLSREESEHRFVLRTPREGL